MNSLPKKFGAGAVITVVALGGAASAAATTNRAGTKPTTIPSRSKVDVGSAEKDSLNANAAYEVHVTKADGSTQVFVLEDSSFKVLSSTTEAGHRNY